jgi:transcriptional regulator with XRE-family HTH domain
MTNNINNRLKSFIDSLSMSYEELANETGIARRTWQRQVENDASIKSDYLLLLKDKFGADINWILTGENSGGVSSEKQDYEESVSSMTHSESTEKYRAFKDAAPEGSMAAKLKLKDYDNPMVVLSYAITDLNREWEAQAERELSKEEREEWLKEALTIVQRIATKHLKDLGSK